MIKEESREDRLKRQLRTKWTELLEAIKEHTDSGLSASQIIKKNNIRGVSKDNPDDPIQFTNTTNFKSYLYDICSEMKIRPPKLLSKRKKRKYLLQEVTSVSFVAGKKCTLPQVVFDHLEIGDFDLKGNRRGITKEKPHEYYLKIELKKMRKSGRVVVELTKPVPNELTEYEKLTGQEIQ